MSSPTKDSPSPPSDEPPGPAARVSADDRLRVVETRIAEMRGEIGVAPRERLATLEAKLQSLATTADLERTKRWVVVGVASAGLSVLALIVRVLTWLFEAPSSLPN